MKFVYRPQIDSEKWDLLVASTKHAGIYNYSYFLDLVCENWCVFIDENYSMGIAIPYTNKLSFNIVYTPNFLRGVNFLGEPNQEIAFKILNRIKKEFKVGDLSIDSGIYSLDGETRVYQQVKFPTVRTINTLSKRMLKKFDQSDLYISTIIDLDKALYFIEHNLFQRIEGLKKSDFIVFKKLMHKLNENLFLTKLAVYDSNDELKGCALFLKTKEKLTYMKGVASPESLKEGVMYALLNQLINTAKENNLIFDFGGSNIDSIRQFYTNLGGQDVPYYRIMWGRLPVYYKIAKYIYHYFRKIIR
jgi:N-acetylglutamate synthase-like GNAT family acetyltransferase